MELDAIATQLKALVERDRADIFNRLRAFLDELEGGTRAIVTPPPAAVEPEKKYPDVNGILRKYKRVCALDGCTNEFATDEDTREYCNRLHREAAEGKTELTQGEVDRRRLEASRRYREQNKPVKKVIQPRNCSICGIEFTPKMDSAKLCGKPECKREDHKRYMAKYNVSYTPPAKQQPVPNKPAEQTLGTFDDPWNCEACRMRQHICPFHQGMEDDGKHPPPF